MSAPDYPVNEAERLLALRSSALLDSPAEERFDRITRLAATLFGVKTCLVSLVDSDRLWFKSKVGLEAETLGRDISFCGHAILEQGVFLVTDATQDPRFSDNPLVIADPRIRFYAGAPLFEPGGHAIGTLCLIDSTAREFSDKQKQILRDLADLVEQEIARLEQAEYQRRLNASLARASSVLETSPDMVFVFDREFRFLICTEHPDLPLPRLKLLGRAIHEALPSELGEQLAANVETAFTTSKVIHHHFSIPETGQSFEARYRKIDDKEVLVIVRNTTEQTRVNNELKRLSEVARQTTNSVVITDEAGLTVWVNEGFETLSGYSLEEMIGKRPGDVLQGAETDPETIVCMGKALANEEGFNVDLLNYSKAGSTYWIRVACNPLRDDDGRVKGYIAVQSDITKERQDAELIRRSESLLKAVIDANTIGTWRLNLQNDELLINDKWAALLGYELHELMPTARRTWEDLTHPDDLAYCAVQLEEHATGKIPFYEANIRMKHKNGDWVWINTRGRVSTRTADGRAEWLLGTHFDIDAQMKAESNFLEQSRQMQAIVENMLDGVISIDGDGVVCTFNRAAECIFGYSRGEMVGRRFDVLMSPYPREGQDLQVFDFSGNSLSDLIGRNGEFEALHKDGTIFPVELGLAEVEQSDGTRFIGIVRDITQRRQVENEVRQLAFYDALTQLPNRRLLLDRLQQAIASCVRTSRYAALLFLDLDNFKNLNDSAGHNKGDLLLGYVAQRLTMSVRQGDTVSRLGGDEFVVVVEDLSRDEKEAAAQAEAIAEKINAELTQGFDLDGLQYNSSASIGVTMFRNGDLSLEELLKQADLAMYKAKATGRNGICFFDPFMQVAVSLRAAMERDLHNALSGQQFKLVYQKQVDRQGRVIGAEALLRWLHPEKGVVSPGLFIPLAEETGLILPIGEWVLREACRTLAQWSSDPARAGLTMAVNLSVVQFTKKDIVKTVLDALRVSGANPRNLKLEITESLLAKDVQAVKAKMIELQSHGVAFSIDDFGTGYSSLFYLRQLPIDQLKIDQSFVREIIHSPNDQAIAKAVITLAHSMRLNVIAEGVETDEQRLLLERLGCECYQGYLFGKPCALENLVMNVDPAIPHSIPSAP